MGLRRTKIVVGFQAGFLSRSWIGGALEESQGWSSAFIDQGGAGEEQSSIAKDITQGKQRNEASEEASFDSILNSYTKHIVVNHPTSPVGTPELSNMLSQVYGAKVRAARDGFIPDQ